MRQAGLSPALQDFFYVFLFCGEVKNMRITLSDESWRESGLSQSTGACQQGVHH
jgi:hypothetical protein